MAAQIMSNNNNRFNNKSNDNKSNRATKYNNRFAQTMRRGKSFNISNREDDISNINNNINSNSNTESIISSPLQSSLSHSRKVSHDLTTARHHKNTHNNPLH